MGAWFSVTLDNYLWRVVVFFIVTDNFLSLKLNSILIIIGLYLLLEVSALYYVPPFYDSIIYPLGIFVNNYFTH